MAKTTRKTKLRDERRDELIDVAQRLFLEKGYEQTAVSDIVKAMNVAQGTFYYHFKSKTEVLEAIVEKTVVELEADLKRIIANPNADAVTKLKQVFRGLFRLNESYQGIMEFVHQDSNVLLHHKLTRLAISRISQLVSELVAAGIAEGRFKVRHVPETSEILVAIMVHVFHQPDVMNSPARYERMRETLADALPRILGIENLGSMAKD